MTPDPAGYEAPADMTRLTDGSLLVAGSAASGSGSLVVKFQPNGGIDSRFGDQGKVRDNGPGWQQLDLLPDGKIMLGGGQGTELVFARLFADGRPDPSFGLGGQMTLDTSGLSYLSENLAPDAGLSSLKVLTGGEIRAFGGFAGCGRQPGSCGSVLAVGLERNGDPSSGYGSSGVKDMLTYGDAIVSTIFDDGRSLVVRSQNYGADGGQTFAFPVTASGYAGQEVTLTGRYNYSPALDLYDGDTGGSRSNRVLLTSGDSLWALLADGRPDLGFGIGGEVDIGDLTQFVPNDPRFSPTDITTDEKGRILISGGLVGGWDRLRRGDASASSGTVARLYADGRIDQSFGGGGLAQIWPGRRADRSLDGRTAVITAGDSIILAGMGPAGDSYGFTVARIENGEAKMPTCDGTEADYVGTPGTDWVQAHRSVVVTGAGDDVVKGGFRSSVCTGAGDDVADTIYGPTTVFGGNGNDIIRFGFNRQNVAHGGRGDDRITGALRGNRSDLLFGERGNDIIYGGGGDDRIFGGKGSDQLLGGWGRDQLVGGPGQDLLLVGRIGPNITEYVSRKGGTLLRVIFRPKMIIFALHTSYICSNSEKVIRWSNLFGARFNEATGRLKQVFAEPQSWELPEVDAKVQGQRVSGFYRNVFRTFDMEPASTKPVTCRTGKGPYKQATVYRDSWTPFSAEMRPKSRQFAKQ